MASFVSDARESNNLKRRPGYDGKAACRKIKSSARDPIANMANGAISPVDGSRGNLRYHDIPCWCRAPARLAWRDRWQPALWRYAGTVLSPVRCANHVCTESVISI